jgi:hypothetical protein
MCESTPVAMDRKKTVMELLGKEVMECRTAVGVERGKMRGVTGGCEAG